VLENFKFNYILETMSEESFSEEKVVNFPSYSSILAQQVAYDLMVLRRFDAHIEEILEMSPQVALYTFYSATSTWERKKIEGSLFVVKRTEPPVFRFMVLNRLNTSNLLEEISDDLELQINGTNLLYRHKNGVINSIWFYNDSEREKIHSSIQRIIAAIKKARSLRDLLKANISVNSSFFSSTTSNTFPVETTGANSPNEAGSHQGISLCDLLLSSTQQKPVVSENSQVIESWATMGRQEMPVFSNNDSGYLSSSNAARSSSSCADIEIKNSPVTCSLGKEQLKNALMSLVKDDQFIDLIYKKLQHHFQ